MPLRYHSCAASVACYATFPEPGQVMLKRSHILAMALSLGAAMMPAATHAQSDILLRLRSGSPLGDRFRVDSASGFVAKGYIGIGIIPFTGAGDRTEWHPFKAGFRTGGVDGTQWDD